MLVASGLSPYGGLYRVLSAPACGNRWGPSMDNLLPMYERKLSLPRKARSPLPGPPFSPSGWPGSRKARLHELLSAWRMFQTGSSEDVNVAPLRIFDNLHCDYWRRLHPVSPAHRQEARRGNKSNGPPQTSPREKTPREACGNPLLLLPVGRSAGAAVERCCRFGPLRWPGLPPPCRVSALGSTGAAARCCGCGAVCGGRGGALHRRCRAGRAAARGVLLWRSAVAGAVGSTSAATPAC